jgi:hypothetical protein
MSSNVYRSGPDSVCQPIKLVIIRTDTLFINYFYELLVQFELISDRHPELIEDHPRISSELSHIIQRPINNHANIELLLKYN